MKNGSERIEKKKRPRTCVACGQESPKRALLRVVRTSEGRAVYDPTGKADGRGAYVCSNAECVKTARKRKAFTKALNVPVADDLYDQLESICVSDNDERV
jgi:uncharacterized protein